MTSKSSGSKEKGLQKEMELLGVREWREACYTSSLYVSRRGRLEDPSAEDYAKFISEDDEFAAAQNLSEYARIKRERRKLAACLLFSTLLCAALIFLFYAVKEKDKILGITLAYRNKTFPVPLPYGDPQLRSIEAKYKERAHGLNVFSPFIAATQEKGKLYVVTNLTSPNFHAFMVQHPEIVNVSMVTLNFFCSPLMCFYIKDVYNRTFFNKSGLALRDLSSQLVKMPLPDGMRFVKAQACLYLDGCRILLENNKGKQHFAIVVRDDPSSRPVIQPTQFPRIPSDMMNKPIEVRGFRINPSEAVIDHIALWIDGHLTVVSNDNGNNRQTTSIIPEAEVDEVVQFHEIASKVWAMLLMKEDKQQGKTRIRFYALSEGTRVVRYDELTIVNRPSAISVFVWNDTFEICELPQDSSHLKCYNSLLPHEPATK